MKSVAKKAKPRKRAPKPEPVPQQVDVSVHGLGGIEQKAKRWQPILATVGAALTIIVIIIGWWNWANLPTMVFSGTLREVETKLRTHVDETKQVVITHADNNAQKINTKVGGLEGTLQIIQQTQRQQTLDAMRRQEEQFDLDLAKLADSLSSVETQIGTSKGGATAFLRERKQVLDSQKRALERKATELRDRIARMERPDRPAQ